MRNAARLLCFLALSGCYTVKLVDPSYMGREVTKTDHAWAHSLFWGFVPLGTVDLGVCGEDEVRSVKTQIGGLGLVAYVLTVGIWTPMHVKITCVAPGGFEKPTGALPEDCGDDATCAALADLPDAW
jgi:hypothetical protein